MKLTPTHVLPALLTVLRLVQAIDPVTQTACRCHESASPWISLWKTTWRGIDKVKVKLCEFGYDPATIKNDVGSLKRALRNTNSNNSSKTVVLGR